MAVTVYRSTDSSAPTLSGTAGDLINLLDKCLVSGYGSKAAAGWSKPYTATNQAVFRPGSGVQHYFHVDDNSPNGTALGREAFFRGSEGATGFQTWTNPFPTIAQLALGSGIGIRKSATADATTRSWIVIADDRTCWSFILSGDVAGLYCGQVFGEFYSLVTGTDLWRSMVAGRTGVNAAESGTTGVLNNVNTSGAFSGITNHYMPRAYTGLGGSTQMTKYTDIRLCGNALMTNSVAAAIINGPDSAIHLSPVWVGESGGHTRGRLRGYYGAIASTASVADGDTISGGGAFAGRTFLIIKNVAGGSLTAGHACIDITGPWETN